MGLTLKAALFFSALALVFYLLHRREAQERSRTRPRVPSWRIAEALGRRRWANSRTRRLRVVQGERGRWCGR